MRPRLLYACMGLVVILIGSLSAILVHFDREAARQRDAIAGFSQSVQLGMTRDEADHICRKVCVQNPGWGYRAGIEQVGVSTSVVESPLTFGARNWVAYLVFDGEVLAAVLVRTEDSPRERPIDSPLDRVANPRRLGWLDLPRSHNARRVRNQGIGATGELLFNAAFSANAIAHYVYGSSRDESLHSGFRPLGMSE